jgi:hypothetical protein
MKFCRCTFAVAALLTCAPIFAQVKPCEELKNEIDAKLKEKGVVNYTLEIVPADQIADQKVVGSCDGGKNKITYTKDADTAPKE